MAAASGNVIETLMIEASKGDANAQNAMGLKYVFGEGVAKDATKAEKYFRLAVKGGNLRAFYNLAFLIKDEKPSEARSLIQEAAEKGLAEAQYTFSGMLKAEGNNKDAYIWMQRSAKQDFTNAIFGIGVMLDSGIGVEKDPKLAKEYYALAAQKGNQDAAHNLRILNSRESGAAAAEEDDDNPLIHTCVRTGRKSILEFLEGTTIPVLTPIADSDPRLSRKSAKKG